MPDPYSPDEQQQEIPVSPPPDLTQAEGPAVNDQGYLAFGPAPVAPQPQHLGFDANGQPVYGYPAPRPGAGMLKWALIAAGGFFVAKVLEGSGKRQSRRDEDDDED